MKSTWLVAVGCSMAMTAVVHGAEAQPAQPPPPQQPPPAQQPPPPGYPPGQYPPAPYPPGPGQQQVIVQQQGPQQPGVVVGGQFYPQGQVVQTGNGSQPTIIVVDGGGDGRPVRQRSLVAEDGAPPPPGYHAETTSIKGLWIAGIATFGAGYVFSALGGAIAGATEDGFNGSGSASAYYGVIPLVGPWLYLGDSEMGAGGKGAFAFLGVIQLVGAGMFIGGLAAHTNIWVSNTAKTHIELIGGPGSVGLRGTF